MSSIFVRDTRSEKIFIGYCFFLSVLKPLITFFGKFLYYRVIRKLKILKFLRIKIKRLLKQELIILLKDFHALVRFFALFCFIFEPVRLLYFKLGEQVLIFFGLFFYRLMLSVCPVFLIVYNKIVQNSFLQKMIEKIKSYFQTDYMENDERIILYFVVISLLSIMEIIVFFLKCCLILVGALCLGQESKVILGNLTDIIRPFSKRYNVVLIFKDLVIILKNQFLVRIQYERAQWENTTNTFSRLCRICSWCFFVFFVIYYAFSFKKLAFNLKKSSNFA